MWTFQAKSSPASALNFKAAMGISDLNRIKYQLTVLLESMIINPCLLLLVMNICDRISQARIAQYCAPELSGSPHLFLTSSLTTITQMFMPNQKRTTAARNSNSIPPLSSPFLLGTRTTSRHIKVAHWDFGIESLAGAIVFPSLYVSLLALFIGKSFTHPTSIVTLFYK